MAVEANNDGNNVKCLFVVVLSGCLLFYFWVLLGDIGVGGLFLLSCRPPCFQLYLVSASVLVLPWGYLIIQERQYFRAFFSGLFLLLFIMIFILLSTSVQSFLHVQGFYNCHIRTLLQCPVLFYLIWLICCYGLVYLVLFTIVHTKDVFPTRSQPFV